MKISKHITIFYIAILGITIGASVYAGAIAAPIIFNSQTYLGNKILTHYQEGLIMSENFLRLGYLVTFTVIIVTLYEGFKYKTFNRDAITLIGSFLVICTGLLFVYYYLPQILEFQKEGAVIAQNKIFKNTHVASEFDFKLFTFSLVLLLMRTLYRVIKS